MIKKHRLVALRFADIYMYNYECSEDCETVGDKPTDK